MKTRRVLRLEGKDRHNTADVAKANHPRRAHRSLEMSLQVHHVPAESDWQSGKEPHGHEEDGGVFEVGVRMHAEEDADAGEGEEEREEHEGQCVPGFGCGEADED